jgi:hypothetical protein
VVIWIYEKAQKTNSLYSWVQISSVRDCVSYKENVSELFDMLVKTLVRASRAVSTAQWRYGKYWNGKASIKLDSFLGFETGATTAVCSANAAGQYGPPMLVF